MKRISVVSPCFNEEENVEELYAQVKSVFAGLRQYTYEHIYIDNASTDRTVEILRRLASQDKNVKVIINTRNFGHIRSPYHALLEARGDAVIGMASDLQDPPSMIPELLAKWESGYKIVATVKNESDEFLLMFLVRKLYYGLVRRLGNVNLISNFTGFGVFDQVVIEALRAIDEPYPYFRGLISEIGWPAAVVPFRQPRRKRGITKNNFYTLYDMAMLGIINHSRVPLRVATMAGFAMSAVSLLIAMAYLVGKLLFWYEFAFGLAPVLIGVFFFSSVQLFFIGVLGEYIGAILTQVQHRPHVFERERINF